MSLPHPWQAQDIDDSARLLSWLREIEQGIAPTFNVLALGAVGDGLTDDTAAIQAAINKAAAASGGIVYLPVGTYKITSTLTIGDSVRLIGAIAPGYFFGSTTYTKGSVLRWAGGASSVVTITPSSTTSPVIAPGIENVEIDGQGVATFCLRLEAVYQGVFKNLALRAALTSALYTGQTALGGFSGSNFVYGADFQNLWIDQNNASYGDGIQLDGNATGGGDTTLSTFKNILIHYYNGNGLTIINADHNSFHNFASSRNPSGTGIGIELKGNNTGGQGATYNNFYACWPDDGGVTARATGMAQPSVYNTFWGYSTADGAPLPTVETGASLQYFLDTGAARYITTTGKVIAGGSSEVVANSLFEVQGTNANTDPLAVIGSVANGKLYTLRIRNSSGQSQYFIAQAANDGMTGTISGDSGAGSLSTNKFFHIGGTTSTIKVGRDNSLGFFNVTSVAQQNTTGTATGFTAGAGTGVTDQSTFTGGTGSTAYRISDIVKALKAYGLLAP